MFSTLKRSSLKLGLIFVAPLLAFPAAIQVNGTCELGNCASVDVQADGGSASGSANYLYTFGNGDKYQISGPFSTSNSLANGTTIFFDPAALYMGNSSNASAPSQADVLTIDLLQSYNYAGSTVGYYDEDTVSSVTGPIASNSTYQAQLLYNGNGLGVMGPYGPGTNVGTGEVYLSSLPNPFSADFQFIYSFGAGSDPGALIATVPPGTATPEPASLACVLGGLATLAFARFRGNRSPAKNI